MKWRPFVNNELEYDLSHVHPFEWEVGLPKKQGGPIVNYKFHVEFSDHVFTTEKVPDSPESDVQKYDSPNNRFFDFDRYELSKQLPGIIRELDSKTCYHTAHRNYLTIEITGEAQLREYEIYFRVSRTKQRGWMRLYIESAYVRDTDRLENKPKKRKIKFNVIARNTLEKREIKAPK